MSPHSVGRAPSVRASTAVTTEPHAAATAPKMAMRTTREVGMPTTSWAKTDALVPSEVAAVR